MPSVQEQLEGLTETAGRLIATRARIWKLKATSQVSEGIAGVAASLVIAFFILVALLMLSIGAAIWIGTILGSSPAGFCIIGGVYLVTGFLLFLFRRALLQSPITNRLIRAFIKNNDHEEEDRN